jgi:NAD(P)-dependent dehydrogenase (short-subunit alcohol dehydrogenase family)
MPLATDRGWTAADVPDQSGKTCLVTGATSGIGFRCARVLAARGARVILACRDRGRGRRALDALLVGAPRAQPAQVTLDLASLASVRGCAEEVRAASDRLDILVNNAGLMAIPFARTADGFEMQFGVNHLGHFALTGLLLPLLSAAPAARVVTVSSLVHRRARMVFEDLLFERRPYKAWTAYGQSKLANLLFTFELERRMRHGHLSTAALAAHPGYAATELQARGPRLSGSTVMVAVMRIANALFAQSAEAGAWPLVRAATDPAARGGEFYGPRNLGEMRGPAVRVEGEAGARDQESAERLWRESERLTGVRYDI